MAFCENEVEVWLEADCELSLEDLRLSPKISCEEGASPLEDQELRPHFERFLVSFWPFWAVFHRCRGCFWTLRACERDRSGRLRRATRSSG